MGIDMTREKELRPLAGSGGFECKDFIDAGLCPICKHYQACYDDSKEETELEKMRAISDADQ